MKGGFCYNEKIMRCRTVRIFGTIFILLIFFFAVSPFVQAEIDQIERLIQNLNSEYRDLRMSSIWTLGRVKDPRAVQVLINTLGNKDPLMREKAAEALGHTGDLKAVESLISILNDQEETIREAAAGALGKITGKDFGQDPDKWQKWWAQNKENVRRGK